MVAGISTSGFFQAFAIRYVTIAISQTSNFCSRTIGLNAVLVGENGMNSSSTSSEAIAPLLIALVCGWSPSTARSRILATMCILPFRLKRSGPPRGARHHAGHDAPVERQDDRQIDLSEQVVGPHQRGRHDLATPLVERGHLYCEAEIKVLVGQPHDDARRALAEDGERADPLQLDQCVVAARDETERPYEEIAKPHQPGDPAWRTVDRPVRGGDRIK